MTAPRRRIIRPAHSVPANPQQQRRLLKLRASLEREQALLARWMGRLKRAFHAVEKAQQRIARMERQLTQREELNAADHRGGGVADR
jgi:hypothetical protein